ncbi:hypothetical protein T06_6852 [Trichinella sp. T6]|nr:hypothetical protein T06_6852 [Trichinella sp. T6]
MSNNSEEMQASWFDADMTMGEFNKRDGCATSSSTSKLGTRRGVDIRKKLRLARLQQLLLWFVALSMHIQIRQVCPTTC